MIKILIVNRAFFHYSETFIYRQIRALGKYSISLLGFRFQNHSMFPLTNVAHIHIPTFTNVADRVISGAIRRFLRIDLPFSFLAGFGVRRLFNKNRIDVVHAHYGWNGIAILPFVKHFNIPLVVSFHGADASYSLKKEKYRKQLPDLFDYASFIILCSPYMLNNLPLRQHVDKVRIVPYGIDIDLFSPVHRQASKNKVKILHVGRIVSKKGVPDLIRVFAKLHNRFPFVELQVIGGGKQLEDCKELAISLGLGDQILFSGPKPNDVVLAALKHCDIFVLNSRTDDQGDQEGLPNGLLEAMSCAKAVVSTYHAGIPDAIKDDVNGLLVNEKDNHQLFEALVRLMNDNELRDRLGKEARKTIVNSFSLAKMETDLCKVIEEAILR